MKKILLTITILLTLSTIFMQEEINRLKQDIADLRSDIENAKVELEYPMDSQSLSTLKQVFPGILDEQLYQAMKRIIWWQTYFETKDGFTTTGTATVNADDIDLVTGAVSGNSASIEKIASWQGLFSFGRKSMMRTAFNLSSVTAVTAYMVVGSASGDGVPAGSYYGFKVVNSTLYGVVKDGTTEATVSLMTITTDTYSLQAEYIPGQSVVFTVNTVQRGTITTNLPQSALNPQSVLMELKVTTNEAVAKTMSASFFTILSSRDFYEAL